MVNLIQGSLSLNTITVAYYAVPPLTHSVLSVSTYVCKLRFGPPLCLIYISSFQLARYRPFH